MTIALNITNTSIEEVVGFTKETEALLSTVIADVEKTTHAVAVRAKNEASPSESPQALMGRVSEHSTSAVHSSHKFHETLEKVNELFESFAEGIEGKIAEPLELATAGFELLKELVERAEEYSHLALEGLTSVAQPLQIIVLIADVKKVAEMVFETLKKGREEFKTAEITKLGFSIVSRACKTVNWIDQLGFIRHAVAHAGRMSIVGSFSSLMVSSVALGDSVIHYTSALKVVKEILNFTVALAGVALVCTVFAHAHILLLALTFSTLILNGIAKIYEVNEDRILLFMLRAHTLLLSVIEKTHKV